MFDCVRGSVPPRNKRGALRSAADAVGARSALYLCVFGTRRKLCRRVHKFGEMFICLLCALEAAIRMRLREPGREGKGEMPPSCIGTRKGREGHAGNFLGGSRKYFLGLASVRACP